MTNEELLQQVDNQLRLNVDCNWPQHLQIQQVLQHFYNKLEQQQDEE